MVREKYSKESLTVKWPYPVRYDLENKVSTDVLVLGGGIAGSWAAIAAAKKGVKVAIVEKGCMIRAGSGGSGVDHWQQACTNPCCKVTPEEMTEAIGEGYGGYFNGITRYIVCMEAYDTLLEMEQMGGKIRDTEDDFKGSDFRDEKTKLLFAYDYENRYTIRVWGAGFKPILAKEIKRQGIDVYERVMITSLLMEGGERGARAVGATGFNVRTGEFYVFEAKAVVSCLAIPERLWVLSTEQRGLASCFFDPNNTGQGYDIAWRAGAEFAMMEKTRRDSGGFGWIPYGVGNANNTWHGCTLVDSNGKEIPWEDRDGRVLKSMAERFLPAPGQKFFVAGGGMADSMGILGTPHPAWYKYRGPNLTAKLPEMIKKGEIVPPLYADLPSMPPDERRAIFGLMVGQEGKTSVPVYRSYTRAGFDPDKDMLQVPFFSNPDSYNFTNYWWGTAVPQLRQVGFCTGGGLVVDWNLRTKLEGLYAAGMQVHGGSEHSGAATSGRYAGRNAAEYARQASQPTIDRALVEEEKRRVYAPLKQTVENGCGYDWMDLNHGIARIMQDYCGEFKNDEGLKIGLQWMKELRESEAKKTGARTPHELMRVLEDYALMTCGEIIMHASLARKASNFFLNFFRIDYPQMNPSEWEKFTTVQLDNGKVKYGELPLNYWLLPPYAPTYAENYKFHCAL